MTDVATTLGISRQGVFALARTGQLPYVKLGGRILIFLKSDVDDLIDRRNGIG